ncbi:MAG TPA: hypothetical protein VJY15_09905 [Candidatus Acidoferrum sp.]|nr:hypothetical protein [Candidatus Acidoferrum sp.]
MYESRVLIQDWSFDQQEQDGLQRLQDLVNNRKETAAWQQG